MKTTQRPAVRTRSRAGHAAIALWPACSMIALIGAGSALGSAAGCSPVTRTFEQGSGGGATTSSGSGGATSSSGSGGATSSSGTGGCGDTTADSSNCGSCGHVCAAGQRCVSSACVCDATSCPNGCCAGDACVDPGPTACGAAGAACVDCTQTVQSAEGPFCTSTGACGYANGCSPGYADLDGDPSNGCESTLPTGVPEALSGNLLLWLAADTGWNGQAWLDQSGNGRDAAVYYGAPGTQTFNGKTVVDFNGGELQISAGFPAWNGLTVFAVSNTSADDALIAMGVSYNPSCTTTPPLGAPGCVAYDMLAFGAGMTLQQCDPSIGTCWQAYSPGVPLGTWIRTTAWEDPSADPSFRSFYNGADNGTFPHNMSYPYPAPWYTPRTDTILGWRNYRGLVGELIVFNVPLSDASRQAIDTYLAKKWGL